MNELYPSDAQLNALSGLSDAQQEVLFIATGESPYYTSFYKMLYRLLDVARRAGDLRVYKDGDLTFGVRAGKFADGAAVRDFAGVCDQALADNAANSIYLTAAGTLAVSTGGFPATGATPHIPLAVIVTASGAYSHTDITDCRGRSMFRPLTAMTGLSENLIVASVSSLAFTVGAENGADTRAVSVQVKDALGNNLSGRFKVRLWVSASDCGAPDAAGNTVAVTTGTQMRAIAANADYELITDAAGTATVTVGVSGAATRYVLAEIDGRIYSTGAISWNA